MLFLRLSTIIAMAAFLIMVVQVKPAQADPHALFYTAVGQQQLFFNMLAALDQADYVEPTESRDELLEERQRVIEEVVPDYEFIENPVLSATETDLAAIITRPVTLEGNDLWTTYIAHQFALEKVRRSNISEIVERFCERGLGVYKCGLAQEDPQVAAERKRLARIVETENPQDAIKIAGNAALNSGTQGDQQLRELAAKKKKGYQSLSWSGWISTVRQVAENNEASGIIEPAISAAQNLGTEPVNNPLAGLEIGADGYINVPAGSSIDAYIQTMAGAARLSNEALSTKLAAQNVQARVNEQVIFEGAVADAVMRPRASGNGPSAQYRDVTVDVVIPPYVKIEETKQAVGAIVAQEENLKFAGDGAPSEEHQLAQDPPRTLGATSRSDYPSVAGITDDTEVPDEGESFTDRPPIAAYAPVSPTSGTREETPRTFLQLISGSSQSAGCGDTCSLSSILQGYSSSLNE